MLECVLLKHAVSIYPSKFWVIQSDNDVESMKTISTGEKCWHCRALYNDFPRIQNEY
jgi:hypothetical protein